MLYFEHLIFFSKIHKIPLKCFRKPEIHKFIPENKKISVFFSLLWLLKRHIWLAVVMCSNVVSYDSLRYSCWVWEETQSYKIPLIRCENVINSQKKFHRNSPEAFFVYKIKCNFAIEKIMMNIAGFDHFIIKIHLIKRVKHQKILRFHQKSLYWVLWIIDHTHLYLPRKWR